MSLVFGGEFLAQGRHLSHQRCSAGIRTWLSADQSSSSTLTESSFLFDACLIVKSSHLYLYSAFNNTNCVKATSKYQNRKMFELKAFHY